MLLALIVVAALAPLEQSSQPPPQPAHVHPPAAESVLFPLREASGTAWLPDLTPMHGVHRQARGWELMVHGNLFLQYLYESGGSHRRGQQAGSINWAMGMARRPLGAGRFGVRAMMSLEPWTIGGCGYPDLLASGEVCDRDTIHDLQHPHDLFMEAVVEYDRPLTGGARLQLYGGPAGEPALGPPAFPHRLSAFGNPIAPITHHWLDATHITYGVVTAGVYGRRWKAEGSVFNGREPDEARVGFDLAALDSVSGRVTWMPSDHLAIQVSAGHLHEAEEGAGAEPRVDVNRITTSAIYHRRMGASGLWATTVAYGRNSELDVIPGGRVAERTHAAMFETSVTAEGRHTWYGRVDLAEKPAHDLHAHEFIPQVFLVAKLQGGYVRHFNPWNGWRPGIGVSLSTAIVPSLLAPRYNGHFAPGFGVYFALQPASH